MHVTLVGAGNIGFAMLCAWAKSKHYRLSVVEPNDELLKRAEAIGAKRLDNSMANSIDVLVIATKPQTVPEAIATHGLHLAESGLIISVAAGVKIASMASEMSRPVPIIRAMPNTPASVGEGMIVCCPNDEAADERYRAIAGDLLASTGRVAFVNDEALMDAVTAVSGSGPAYVFTFIEALQSAAVAAGIDSGLALLLAKQTIFGSAKLALESEDAPAKLRQQVTSPNGTTAAALSVLMRERSGMAELITEAVAAAKARSIELGKH